MLKVAAAPYFEAIVDISVPGEKMPTAITVKFKHMKPKELGKYFEDHKEGTDVDLLSDLILDWKGVDKPYSKEALAELLESYGAAPNELIQSYIRELTQSKVKN